MASVHATEQACGHREVLDSAEWAHLLDTTHRLDLGSLGRMGAASLDGLGYQLRVHPAELENTLYYTAQLYTAQ